MKLAIVLNTNHIYVFCVDSIFLEVVRKLCFNAEERKMDSVVTKEMNLFTERAIS